MKTKHIGLLDHEVHESRAKYGDNTLTETKREPLWRKFVEKFSDPIIIILLVALGLSVGVAAYQYIMGLGGLHLFLEPVGIFVAVLLATLIGFLFEVNADKKFEILNCVTEQSRVKVVRNCEIMEIAKSEVVVGDTVCLEAGEEVPADCLLLEAVALQVNESTLTGEPLARKSADQPDSQSDATYASNMVMRGTTIVEGHATALVLSVGDNTEYGKVYRGAQIDNNVETPLNKQLTRLASLVAKASYAVAAIIVVARMCLYFSASNGFDYLDFGSYLLSTVMLAVTVVVVSVPEGLPMSVTLSLALSMQRMLRSNNLVRKMHACETMGATTVICTDKTGTLTQNKMQVFEAQFYQNNDREIVNRSIALNSTAHLQHLQCGVSKVLGNPTEGALLLWLEANGVDYRAMREEYTIVDQLPFSTERKYMATVVNADEEGKKIVYVKGAPEVLLSMSQYITVEGATEKIDIFRKGVMDDLRDYQNMAMRTLCFAYIVLDQDFECFENGRLADLDLTLLGIVAISDPIRKEVPDAVRSCQAAGIAIKIVTGDTPATATQIARQIGLWSSADSAVNHITGAEFESLSDEELLQRVDDLKIMSRARPIDKQRLVQLLQSRGEVVAVTGDGTNDAPALKRAQIGLSMGDGTSVAKEASDITILDNSFSTISDAVMWGRSLYQNIQRFILFQLTINVVACFVVLLGALFGSESPLTVTQMLWVNLIMDTFAALALASLPPSQRVMQNVPRSSSEHIISSRMARQIVSVALLFVGVMFSLMQYFKYFDVSSLADFSFVNYCASIFNFAATNGGFSPYEMSLMFTTFVMLQFWNLFNARAFMSGRSAFSGIAKCGGFVATLLLILVGQWAIVTFGGAMFDVVPLHFSDWAIVILLTSLVLFVAEATRLVRRFY